MSREAMHVPADLPVGNPAGLDRLDVAFGTCIGREPREPLPALPRGTDPRTLVREITGGRLEAGPYYVAFTGGRDSAVALAIAADVAREHGLPQPVPVTMTFTDAPEAQDAEWSERIMRHLRLDDWIRVPIGDELDVLGPVARRALEGAGPTFPSTAYTLLPALDAARGGMIAVATGGADFFSFWRWHPLAAVLAGARRPRRSDLPLLVLALTPPRARARAMGRAATGHMPEWLRPEARTEAQRVIGAQFASVPRRFDRAVAIQHTHRCFAAAGRSIQAMADVAGTTAVAPTLDPRTLSLLRAAGGWLGRGGRSGFSELLAGDLLPPGALAPRRSVSLSGVLDAGGGRRRFAETWDGSGVDEELVDPERLRKAWSSEDGDVRASTLLHAAWLHAVGAGTLTPAQEPSTPRR